MQKLNFTTINHEARLKFSLTTDEYCVADIIHNMATNPSNAKSGWCYAKKETIADFLGISRASIFRALKRLNEKKLIEKHEELPNLIKTTSLWYDSVIIKQPSQNETPSIKMRPVPSQNETPTSIKMRPDTIDKDIYKDNNNRGSTLSLTFSQKRILKQQYPNVDVETTYEKFRAYQRGNGKSYHNPLEAFRVWLIEDNKKNKPREVIRI